MKFPKIQPTGIGTTGATGIVPMTLHNDIPTGWALAYPYVINFGWYGTGE